MAITICVVQGRNGLLLVDTRASPAEAAELPTQLDWPFPVETLALAVSRGYAQLDTPAS